MHFHIYVVDGVFEAVDGDDGDRSGKVILLARHGGGFSVYASVCICADDRVGMERLLRYCARPPFAMERLHRMGQDHLPKFHTAHYPKPQSGGKQDDMILTRCEFIVKIAALVSPPRMHRHRYFGVLAPNSPLRAASLPWHPCQ